MPTWLKSSNSARGFAAADAVGASNATASEAGTAPAPLVLAPPLSLLAQRSAHGTGSKHHAVDVDLVLRDGRPALRDQSTCIIDRKSVV